MGADEARARGSLRFSLGHTTTQADVDALGAAIGDAVARARRAAASLTAACPRLISAHIGPLARAVMAQGSPGTALLAQGSPGAGPIWPGGPQVHIHRRLPRAG